MFQNKKQKLFDMPTTGKSGFIAAAEEEAAVTVSGNGAKKYSALSSELATQFGSVSNYKNPRDYKEVARDMIKILSETSPKILVSFVLYIRLVTRKTVLWERTQTEEVQKGAGLRHEGIMRMLWLAINKPKLFWDNIHLFIAAGSWKDIIMMLSYDLQYHGWEKRQLNWDAFWDLIRMGLQNESQSELIKKYLPQIKAKSKCTTVESQADNIIAKWLCSKLFGNEYKHYKKYRRVKSSGTAHEWQQLISQGKHNLIDFDSIHGRALHLLVHSKYLRNQNLTEKYSAWISERPKAKFTGYPHELTAQIGYNKQKYELDTINAQWNELLQKAGGLAGEYIVVKDTSGSMDSTAFGTKLSSYHIAKTLSIFFAQMLKGAAFGRCYIDFSSKAILRRLHGETIAELWHTEQRTQSANTNFLAVAELFAKVFKEVSESDFPKGIICISDGEFDSTKMFEKTNIEAFRKILLSAGFSSDFVQNFSFVFWDIRNNFYGKYRNTKFETHTPQDNVFYFGGYDPSVISFLMGGTNVSKPKNADDLVWVALNQELMSYVKA
ncbi:hypothetical protein [Leptolyngbya phage Lbo-JY46]